MAYQLQDGVFSLDTYVTQDGENAHVVISLDLGHSEIREMLAQAITSRGRQSRRANGALVIRAIGARQQLQEDTRVDNTEHTDDA
jgi:hypothetical protein